MNVIAINLTLGRTEVLEGRLKKDMVKLRRQETYPSAVAMVEEQKLSQLIELFADIRLGLSNKQAPVYLGLADNLIKKIKFQEIGTAASSPEQMQLWMAQAMQLLPEEYYISLPLQFEKRKKIIATGIAVRKTYIDLIIQAADAAKLNLQSIQPATLAMLFYINEWQREHCVVEVGEIQTSITSYNPIYGMMNISLPYGWRYFLDQQQGQEEFIGSLSKHDYAAYTTFGISNNDIPIYLLSTKGKELSDLLTGDVMGARLRDPLRFAQEHFYLHVPDHLPASATAAGLLLTPLHERMVRAYESDSVG